MAMLIKQMVELLLWPPWFDGKAMSAATKAITVLATSPRNMAFSTRLCWLLNA